MSKKYKFDVSKLEQGDILFSSTSAKSSRAIASLTGGDFSHAMIWVDNTIIHAMPDGVYSKNPQRLLFDNPQHFSVMRLVDSPNEDAIFKAKQHARLWVGGLYSKREAAKSVLYHQTDMPPKSPEQYCSKLVAECYLQGGIRLVHNADYCTPNDLAKSELLNTVSGYYLEAKQEDIDKADSFDPNLYIQRETFLWLEKVRVLASRYGENKVLRMDDVGSFLLEHPEHDKEVCQSISTTLYLYLYDIDRKIRPHMYDKELLFKEFAGLSEAECRQTLLIGIKINRLDLEKREADLKKALENAEQSELDYFRLERAHKTNIYNESYRRVEVLHDVWRRFGFKFSGIDATE